MFKNYIYLNILFIFGLLLFFYSQKSSVEISKLFYFFTSFYCVLISILFINNEYTYQNREEANSYKFLFLGFFIYGLANFLWYFNEAWFKIVSIEVLNLLFIFQVFTKHYFLRFLSNQKKENYFQVISKLFSINLAILLIALFGSLTLNLDLFGLDFYFIFESVFSIIFISYFLKNVKVSHLNLGLFLIGNIFWLIADVNYMFQEFNQSYFVGNISDFIYFVGFYFMIHSILFKNFNFDQKLNNYFEKSFSFS